MVDTHLLIWSASEPDRLSSDARAILEDVAHELFFSALSIWEVAIKYALGRGDFLIQPGRLRQALLGEQFGELTMTSEQAIAADALPSLHRDPFDRGLIGQAAAEGLIFLTSDKRLGAYRAPVMLV